jgi:hypothetical protein
VSRCQLPRGGGWKTAAKYLTSFALKLEWIGDGRRYLFGEKMSLSDGVVYQLTLDRGSTSLRTCCTLVPAGIRQRMDRIAAGGSLTPMSASKYWT